MKKIRLKNLLYLSSLFIVGILKAQTGELQGLPDWPLVTNDANRWFNSSNSTTNTNIVHWGEPGKTTTTQIIPETPSKNSGPAQPLYDDCGNMLYYLIHNGYFKRMDNNQNIVDNNNDGVGSGVTNLNLAATSQDDWSDLPGLFVVNNQGIRVSLPNDVVMFANAGDGEVQVIKRPGTTNQWFIVYTSHSDNPNDRSPGYISSSLRYSLLEITNNGSSGPIGTFVSDGQGEIFNRVLRVGNNYAHSKATTAKRYIPGTNQEGHYLFVQRRNNWGSNFNIDRFIIDGSPNIQFDISSPAQFDPWWGNNTNNPIAGSPMEFSPNGQLAILIRHENDNRGNIYTIDQDLQNFVTINISSLLVEPDATHAGLVTPYTLNNTDPNRTPSGYLSVNNLATSNINFTTNQGNNPAQNGFKFMNHLERKISALEFSPDGRYLYFVGGGYVNPGRGNVTYLGQIELDQNFLSQEGAYKVRLQIQWPSLQNQFGFDNQEGDWTPWNRSFSGFSNANPPYTSSSARNILALNAINNIQSAYNGNLYFTKTNSNQLWVIPEPNQPLQPLLDPREVNLSTSPLEPNIVINEGWPYQLPDHIDWYEYQETGWINIENIRLGIEEEVSECGCENVDVKLIDVSNGLSIKELTLNSCAEQFDICVEDDKSYNFESSNGIKFLNAIVNGQLNYPEGKNYFDFETALGENVTIKVKNQKTICSDCEPISFTIHKKEIPDSDSDCDFPEWASSNSYNISDIVSDNGQYWRAINIGQTHRQPSGIWGHFGWELVTDPCSVNHNPGDLDPKEFHSQKCEDEFTLCIENSKSYFIEYPSDPDVLHELSFENGQVIYPDNLDFYDISGDDPWVEVSFTIENYKNNLSSCQTECAPITVKLYDDNGLFKTFTNTECELIEICVDKNKVYHMQADNGLTNNNAIVNGVVQSQNQIFDFSLNHRPLEKHVYNFEYKIPKSCKMVCFDDKIEIAIEASWNGSVKNNKTKIIDACGHVELCIDPFFDYYAEFNGVRHLIFDRLTGEAQNGVFSFTTEEVTEVTCCPMNMGIDVNSEDVIHITQDITINQNTTWDNKVYIEDGKIVTVDGVTLDITSMDVIFGECAGITFINGATLRANNSVFRPCDLNKTWRGLVFENNSSLPETGIINECTFKNALTAVLVENNATSNSSYISNVRLTNNLFSNCKAGVVFENITIEKAITGNTFQVDNDKPSFFVDCPKSDVIGGVYIQDCNILTEIAQNDFVNMAANWRFQGLRIFSSSGGSISKNTFVNNENALFMGYSNQISIEGNVISVTSLTSTKRSQFSMGYNNDIRIIGNTFYNSDVNYSSLTQVSPIWSYNSAIGVWFGGLHNIKSNEIRGFENGILAHEVSNSNIGENKIKDAWYYGVYALDPSNVDISCNTIDMELIDGGITVGVGVFYQAVSTPDDNVSSSIRGNCIFETSTAIHIEDKGVGNRQSPVIKNNYLYNYTVNGIAFQDVDATSALGSGLTQTTAGKNTFVSNNIPFGAIDVNASLSSPTTVWGCYGVSSVNGPVNLLGGDLYNSTASCGGQIGTISSGIQEDEICDRIEGNEHLYPRQTFEGRLNLEFEIELEDPTAIEVDDKVDVRSNQFEIYPNPASDEVNISLSSSESDISIINIYQINGTLIRSIELVGQNVDLKINVEDLATGAYLLKVVSDEKVIGQSKLMVTR